MKNTLLISLLILFVAPLVLGQVSLDTGDWFLYEKSASGPNKIAKLDPAVKGLLDDSSVSDMRSTLGLVIGTNVQAYDAGLQSISGLTTAANKGIYTTGSDVYATYDLTSQARQLLDDTSFAAMRTTLGLGTSDYVQFTVLNVAYLGVETITRSSSGGTLNLNLPEVSDTNTYDIHLLKKNGYVPIVSDINGLIDLADLAEVKGLLADGNIASAATWNSKQNPLAAASASISVNSQKITDLATPTAGSDAATKGYVDLGMRFPRGHIYGLQLSNNITDATNDIDIAAGECVDSAGTVKMVLASALTKRLDASWAVGSGNGGLDTGSIADTTYHIFLIRRSDTGVVDALFSTSATTPNLPANYDAFRRIGSVRRISNTIWPFVQIGDHFYYGDGYLDRSSVSSTALTQLTLTVPQGITVRPLLAMIVAPNASSGGTISLNNGGSSTGVQVMGFTARVTDTNQSFYTNSSGQIAFSLTVTSGSLSLCQIYTMGFIDSRGR